MRMIIVNTGIPKSGTSLLTRYQRDLLQLFDGLAGQERLLELNGGGYIERLTQETIENLLKIEREYGSFVVKTHCGYEPHLGELVRSGRACVSCAYRDPRDVILSAIDHGERSRNGMDKYYAFANYRQVKDVITQMLKWCQVYGSWASSEWALMIRYEEMMKDRKAVIKLLADQIGFNLSEKQLSEIHEKHEKNKQTAWNFNKGTTERWKNEMNAVDQATCAQALAEQIQLMGYPLEFS